MAHFIGYVKGRSKTTASRLGTKRTGLTARAQGWDIGGRIELDHSPRNGVNCDVVTFYLTLGSNKAGSVSGDVIARFVLNPDGTVTREV